MSAETKEPMDVYFAVFNCHVNNAKSKAIREFKKTYSPEIYDKEIKPFIKSGIMSIFQEKPNKYTLHFAETIQKYVNA